MNLLSLSLHLYFAINIFMAGMYCQEDYSWDSEDNILRGVLGVLFWSLFWCTVMAISTIYKTVVNLWKRTWLCHYIHLLSEEKKYLGETECNLTFLELEHFKKIIPQKQTLKTIKRRKLAIIEHQIELKKKNLFEQHGEIYESPTS